MMIWLFMLALVMVALTLCSAPVPWMQKGVQAHWVLRNLTAEHKHLLVCQERLKRFQEEGNYHDPESRRENVQWKHLISPPPKKSRNQPSAKKAVLTFFFDYLGH